MKKILLALGVAVVGGLVTWDLQERAYRRGLADGYDAAIYDATGGDIREIGGVWPPLHKTTIGGSTP